MVKRVSTSSYILSGRDMYNTNQPKHLNQSTTIQIKVHIPHIKCTAASQRVLTHEREGERGTEGGREKNNEEGK